MVQFLGFEIGWGWWRPTKDKIQDVWNAKITNLKELRRFLGMCNFFRRHMSGFVHQTQELTELMKKDAFFELTPRHEELIQDIKNKVTQRDALGVPRPQGEFCLFTDASDKAGGGSLFQWQKKEREELRSLPEGTVTGVNRDGTLRKTHDEEIWTLTPIGHWGWKWDQARRNYSTYEQELLSGVLVMSSQRRILNNNKIVWMTDQKAFETFTSNAPPQNSRLQRWWIFLSQLPLKICHMPGKYNELCDFISRAEWEGRWDKRWEKLAEEAFSKMDAQLDLRMEVLRLEGKRI